MRLARALLGVAAAVLLVVLTRGPAAAHASLLSSDTSQNALVAQTPDRIVLTFNEPVRLDTDGVHGFRGPAASTTVVALRWLVLGMLAAGVVGLAGAVLRGKATATAPLWNVVLVSAVLLIPLERLYAGGLPLRDLLDWLTWLDGLTTLPTMLLVAGVLLSALLATTRARRPMIAALAAASVAAVGTFAMTTSGGHSPTQATRAADTGPPTYTSVLGATGDVALVVPPLSGRSVRLDLRLTATDGRPLEPYADPACASPTTSSTSVTRPSDGPVRADTERPWPSHATAPGKPR